MSDEIDLNNPDVVDCYDDLSFWSAMAGLLLLRHLELVPGIRALDVGCGTGFPALELAQRLGPNANVSAVDIWSAALVRARRKADIWAVDNVTFIEADARALPFPDSSFELIVSNLGINNFADPVRAMAECRRVARPDARIALATNLQGTMAEFYAAFRAVLGSSMTAALDAHIAHRATVPGTFALLEGAGWKPVRSAEETILMRFADGTAFLRHSFIRLGFVPAWRDLVPESEREAVFDRLQEALNALAVEQHGLTLSVPMAYIEARAS